MTKQHRPQFPAQLLPKPIVAVKKPAENDRQAGTNGSKELAHPALRVPGPFSDDQRPARERMVRRLMAHGVASQRVLAAFGQIPRHRFVDSAFGAQAYEDTSLPIGAGQTISKPSVIARMAELLCAAPLVDPAGGRLGRILEIGTGCGYQAALLSRLAREVYSIERLREMHELARNRLRPFQLPNVHLLFGDGIQGFAKGAPYAGVIAAAGGNALPAAWLDQLAVGGRLVAPLAGPDGRQALVLIDKTAAGYRRQVLEGVHFVPLKSGIA